VGHLPGSVRPARARRRTDRCARRDLPGCVGSWTNGHRRAVRPDWPQMAHRRRHVGAGRRDSHGRRRHHLRRVGGRGRGTTIPVRICPTDTRRSGASIIVGAHSSPAGAGARSPRRSCDVTYGCRRAGSGAASGDYRSDWTRS
jgi:hypothetical protein